MSTLHFQYCQKLVVYSQDEQSVLLCKRKGEADYDGVFSFIGGKMETTDGTLVEGMQREKNEEVGENFKIKVFPTFTPNAFFLKKDGNAMVLPHIYAIYQGGEIVLNEEYSEYQRVPLTEIATFEPKIGTIPEVLEKFKILKEIIHKTESFII
jgi:ADP-ribose pyrophosphatase YjhB (NUDIX family)